MAWVLILVGGVFEMVWAVALKESNGFSRVVPTVLFVLALIASMGLLALGLRELPVGPGYAVWTGTGAVGAAVIGMIFLGEQSSFSRIAPIGLIVAGIVWLALATPRG
jgi:quaternary ammonium compound-resistance protein SugE